MSNSQTGGDQDQSVLLRTALPLGAFLLLCLRLLFPHGLRHRSPGAPTPAQLWPLLPHLAWCGFSTFLLLMRLLRLAIRHCVKEVLAELCGQAFVCIIIIVPILSMPVSSRLGG